MTDLTRAGAGRRRLLRVGVRVRILATVLVLAAFGMAAAGVSTIVMQRNALNDRVDSSLQTEETEFRSIADLGVDPATRQPFTSVADLLDVALRKQAPDRDETFLTLIDGRPHLVPGGERFVALENDAALVAKLAALPADAPVQVREADTVAGKIRYEAVQVTGIGNDDSVGTYVIAHSLARNDRELTAMAERFTVVSLISLLVVAVVGWVVAGRLLRPLRSLRATADRISHTDLSERLEVTGSDDISELASTFNHMLDRLQHAFIAQQEFLDDAGHELKTPITIIRGHLELMESGDARDVTETRELVLDELDRMGRLVQDLILLAKARRPDFVRLQPVELGPLTDEVLDKARGLGDRRWLVDARADVGIDADPQRLTQALLQLADNAVQHTRTGQDVWIGSAVEGDAVRLWVRDSGPGVDPADAGRIFERFTRGPAGRSGTGSGLGLSIVAAIAAGHGGRVEHTRPEAGGARFTLHLPVERLETIPEADRAPEQQVPDEALADKVVEVP